MSTPIIETKHLTKYFKTSRGLLHAVEDTVRAVLDLDQRPAPVESTPGTGRPGLDIIGFAPLMAEGAIILVPPVRAGMDP